MENLFPGKFRYRASKCLDYLEIKFELRISVLGFARIGDLLSSFIGRENHYHSDNQ